jgi:nucleotide-binding universal stress UspA family protein
MIPKTVLACLTDEDGAPDLCRAAAALAEEWDAHLVGLHVMEGIVFYPRYPVGLPQSIYGTVRKAQTARAGRLETAFRNATAGREARAEWRLLAAENDLPADRAVESARAADLVVMGAAPSEGDAFQQHFLQEAVIRRAGRPVLVVPPGTAPFGIDRVLAGWRDTAQATRAVHDLVPLMRSGGALRLVAFEDGPRLGDAGDQMTDLAAALARHGLEVEIARRGDRVPSVQEALEAEARDWGADLLAVGAYGHSRAYDMVLGAVSRGLLRATRMPVLFSR